ncbi:hypothetical protein BZG36_00833 [Bifiguratus adelaidae]|uniref:Uncharacterized protein n=1 Tax=Bifiguratus adelaidae TaxID=1938954 RepID=A0A261Y6U8_9FUNG|nr:hypothetical protein BZG36_00833 [Bifiguratus adelaidae]
MQAYLAKHYGTEKKKKKKGQTLKKGNVGIVDESEFDWNRGIEEEEDDEYAPVVEENVKIREEKVPRADAWEMIREAALENERKREEEGEELEENQPVVVNEGKWD